MRLGERKTGQAKGGEMKKAHADLIERLVVKSTKPGLPRDVRYILYEASQVLTELADPRK